MKDEMANYMRMLDLYKQIMEDGLDDIIVEFFDIDSEKDVKKKIRILEAVIDGRDRDSIPGYYDILTGYDENSKYDIG